MTIDEAIKELHKLFNKTEITKDDEPLYIECFKILASDEYSELCGEAQYYIGDYFNGYDRPDLAIKYWEQSIENGFIAAYAGLGDLYSNKKSEYCNYEKAFHYYSKGAENDNLYSKYMIADMYNNGHYVKRDFAKHKSIIEQLYLDYKNDISVQIFMPDIILRLARIRAKDNKIDEAISFYSDAINRYIRIIVKRKYGAYISCILAAYEEMYALKPFDFDDLNIYNISYLMKKPVRIVFMYKDKSYEVETLYENDEIVVHFGDKWFRNIEKFYKRAKINDVSISTLAYDLYGFEVI